MLFVAVLRIGLFFLRTFAAKPPAPPPAGELRKINARFRCTVCGMEMKVLVAADEDPEPPRHCMEEMEFYRFME